MVRDATSADMPAITEICNYYVLNSTAVFDERPVSEADMLSSFLAMHEAGLPYFVCEQDGAVVGYCYAPPWKSKSAYSSTLETTVYISPSHVGCGLGSDMYRRLIDECRNRGFHALIACITAGNVVSERLHERLGFRKVSQFDEVGRKFGRWLGVVDYQLLL